MKCGDTFFARPPGTYAGEHLRVVIALTSEEDDTVHLVNITSRPPDGDRSTLLYRGDHESLTQDMSFVYWGGAKRGSKSRLQKALDENYLDKQPPLKKEVLIRVLEGARLSDSASNELKEFCAIVLINLVKRE